MRRRSAGRPSRCRDALLQFGDSMLPVGAFSFSNGLEIGRPARGRARPGDAPRVRPHGHRARRPTSDGIAAARRPSARPRRATSTGSGGPTAAVFNRKLNEEMRTMTVRMGRKLAEMAGDRSSPSRCSTAGSRRSSAGDTPGTYPVALGRWSSPRSGCPRRTPSRSTSTALAAMMLGAAAPADADRPPRRPGHPVRGQREGRRRLPRVRRADARRHGAFAPVIDVLAAMHVQAPRAHVHELRRPEGPHVP